MFTGSMPAIVTPFANGAVDEDALAKLVDWHVEEGSSGVVAVGTTGESPTLTHAEHDLVVGGKANQTFALNANSGEQVWQKPVRGQQPLILGPETFINQTGHTYDVSTGDLVSGDALFQRGGCNYAVGGKNLLFLRSNCGTYIDIGSRQEYAIRNLRSGCSNSLVAADGLLNAPCFSVGCVCNYPIQTSFAMFHMPESAEWHGDSPIKQ